MPFASIYPADRRTHFFELVQNKTCTKICNTVYMVFKVPSIQIDDSGLKTEHIHTQEYIMFFKCHQCNYWIKNRVHTLFNRYMCTPIVFFSNKIFDIFKLEIFYLEFLFGKMCMCRCVCR